MTLKQRAEITAAKLRQLSTEDLIKWLKNNFAEIETLREELAEKIHEIAVKDRALELMAKNRGLNWNWNQEQRREEVEYIINQARTEFEKESGK